MSKKYLVYRIVMDVLLLVGIVFSCTLTIYGGRGMVRYVDTHFALVQADNVLTRGEVHLLRQELGLTKK